MTSLAPYWAYFSANFRALMRYRVAALAGFVTVGGEHHFVFWRQEHRLAHLFARLGRVLRCGQVRVRARAAFRRQLQHPRPERRQHPTAGRHHRRIKFVEVTHQCVVGLDVLLGVFAVTYPDAEQKPSRIGVFDAFKRLGDGRRRCGPDIDDPGGQLQRSGLCQGRLDSGQVGVR